MSSLLESIGVNDNIKITSNSTTENNNNCYPRHVLKCKNIFKPKCSKALKRKLRKYKLRKDGKEDQDILDVSTTLLTTLKIHSPTKQLKSLNNISESDRPKNYLFIMARKKQKLQPESTDETPKQFKESENVSDLTINISEGKKETNAFILMMDSRNKSIGSNSPGKEKSVEESEIQERIEKKNLKVKRNLVLQKMAEAKGSLKKKEMEEFQEKCIQQKMDERAKNLKNMITNNKKKKGTKNVKINKTLNKHTVKGTQETVKNKDDYDVLNVETKKSKTLQLVDIFSDNINQRSDFKHNKNLINLEEEEFLKKLSPSMQKKENMLCYFKKLEKCTEVHIDVEHGIPNNNNSDVDKVKLASKNKKKRPKKLSLKNDTLNEVLKDENYIHCNATNVKTEGIRDITKDIKFVHKSTERKKRKRNENTAEVHFDTDVITYNSNEGKEGRPKRQVKKPVKYLDDVQLSSSDEELLIFTSKKRNQIEIKTKHTTKVTCNKIVNISDKDCKDGSSNKTKIANGIKVQKNPMKLAPIFATKPQLTQEEIEAKQKFLHSGIPEQLKKIIGQQKKDDAEIDNIFPTVVHVQQKEPTVADTSIHLFLDSPDNNLEDEVFTLEENLCTKLLTLTQVETTTSSSIAKNEYDTHVILQNIKEIYPKFPVYRTYRLLKDKSKGEYKDSSYADLDNSVEVVNGRLDGISDNSDSFTWVDKYRATSTKHLIGNFESIKELRKWLVAWSENEMRLKNATSVSSDLSDFYDSDTDSRDTLRTTNSLLIISGPVGSGKTSSVYAVAAELSIKVIEVNASSKRTGKVMLQDLQEATQSHKVNRGKGSSENSQKSQEFSDPFILKTYKKKGRPKKSSDNPKNTSTGKNEMLSQPSASQEGQRTGMSLILIDDADIVFEQDDGFSSAIAQLIQYSKRPVILVTSSLTCSHLQRFLQCGRIMRLRPLLPKMLGTWLDIMCLADNGTCWPGLGAKFLDFFKGDMRKTINSLQFYMTTHTKISTLEDVSISQNGDIYSSNIEDEISNMSWAEHDGLNEKSILPKTSANLEDVWNHFMGNHTNLMLLTSPLELFNIWWNIPNLIRETTKKTYASDSEKSENIKKEMKELEVIANVVDTMSVADYLGHNMKLDTMSNITSEPWSSFESDSVSEIENLDEFHRCHEISNEITNTLVTSSIVNAQRILQMEHKTDLHFPGMAVQRKRDKIISRHDSLTWSLNPAAVLDRRALALDYWSSCRTIARIEKIKTDTNSKRTNRYCHYLKSLNVMCENDSYEKLGDSLCCRGKSE